MDISTEIAKSSARGSIYLFIGTTLSTLISAVTSILIGRLLGPEKYGLYSLSMTPASLLMIASGFGITVAIVKYISEYQRKGAYDEIRKVIMLGLLFQISLGVILVAILLSFSYFFSVYLINRPLADFYVKLTSIYLIGNLAFLTINQIYIGLNRMENSSLMVLVQAITKFFIALGLILVGYGIVGAVLGHSVSYFMAAVIGGIVLYRLIRNFKWKRIEDVSSLLDKRLFFSMISFGFPVYLSSVMMIILGVYRNYLLSIYSLDIDIGNFVAATNLSAAITIFVNPIATTLFPAFSKLDINKEIDIIKDLFRYSIKYSSLVVLPITFFLMALSRDVVFAFYGSSFRDSPIYLVVSSLPFLFIGFGYVVINSFLNGLGDTKIIFRMTIITLLFSIPLYPLFLTFYNLVGLLLAMFVGAIAALSYGIYYSYRRYRVSIEYLTIGKVYFCIIVPSLIIMFLRMNLDFGRSIYNILVYGIIFLSIYLIMLPLGRGISLRDLDVLEAAFRDVKLVGWFITILIMFERKLYIWLREE